MPWPWNLENGQVSNVHVLTENTTVSDKQSGWKVMTTSEAEAHSDHAGRRWRRLHTWPLPAAVTWDGGAPSAGDQPTANDAVREYVMQDERGTAARTCASAPTDRTIQLVVFPLDANVGGRYCGPHPGPDARARQATGNSSASNVDPVYSGVRFDSDGSVLPP